MNISKKISMFIAASIVAASLLSSVVTQQTVFAETVTSTNSKPCSPSFLGFPTWYSGLTKDDGSCDIKDPSTVTGGLSGFLWTIALNILDIVLMFVGYLSVGYVLYGGFLMLTTRGIPGEIAQAQLTIRNAVVGLVIAFGSVALINFIAGSIK